MKKTIALLAAMLSLLSSPLAASTFALDYGQMTVLDAEDLAEAGVKAAYEQLKPLLQSHGIEPKEVAEQFSDAPPGYTVTCGADSYPIYSASLPSKQGESWGRASHALFTIINNQLKSPTVKFYAINSGNDLGGMFLTEQQVEAAKQSLPRKTDWPYLPTLEHPWYGQHH